MQIQQPQSLHQLKDLQNKKCSQFDWTGLLANMHQDNLKQKKSTSIQKLAGVYNKQSELKELQNKTQPLPKNLIHHSDVNKKHIYGL